MGFLDSSGLSRLVNEIKGLITIHNTSSDAHKTKLDAIDIQIQQQLILLNTISSNISEIQIQIENLNRFNDRVVFVSSE